MLIFSYELKPRERGDNGLFITLVPKVYNIVFLFGGLTTLETLKELNPLALFLKLPIALIFFCDAYVVKRCPCKIMIKLYKYRILMYSEQAFLFQGHIYLRFFIKLLFVFFAFFFLIWKIFWLVNFKHIIFYPFKIYVFYISIVSVLKIFSVDDNFI